ncbi:MAG: polyribonucleotide nucleotidyltransferase [Bacillota bacterium]
MTQRYEYTLAGRPLVIEVGRLAQQAGGSCLVRYGDTAVLATATASAAPREGIDFFPLTVDYEERTYAIGKIPGSVFRREGRPTEKAILSARLIDRPIRPLFPKGFRNDVQVILTVMSVDHDHAPEVAGMIGASIALSISDIPFNGPIAGVIVGLVDGQYIINPTSAEAENSRLHLTVAGTREAVMMVEAGAHELSEDEILEAIMVGHQEIQKLVDFIQTIAAEVGKAKREIVLFEPDDQIVTAVEQYAGQRLAAVINNPDKLEREAGTEALLSETLKALSGEFPDRAKEIGTVFQDMVKRHVRQAIVQRGERPDGRRPEEIRPISCEVGVLPRTHGSGLFNRGQTQVLTACTLGMVSDVQRLFDLGEDETKRYIHHYNFPPFSVGETRPIRGPGRREIGHGALAERALEPMIPGDDIFPYTIRLVSEVLGSNGSTSMASTCASTLALMDAGVPIKAPVAGVAMGLIKEGHEFVVLSDIQGIEDALGDMDFKVTGTVEGITALQMDIKIAGVDRAILKTALEKAREGRLFILGKLLETIAEPRPELSPYAPRIITITIDPEKIREVIGPGGKMINQIIAECNVEIDIEDDGRVFIASIDGEGGRKAVEWIERLTKEVEAGQVYTGRVTRLMSFGAFVEILPGKEGLIHISELEIGRVEKVEDAVNVGDEVTVKVVEIDRMGRINLSRRAILIEEKRANGEAVPEDRPRGGRPPGGPRRRDGGNRGPRR